MNKSTLRQKRSIGKESPLSKRPKLEFAARGRESPKKIAEEKTLKKGSSENTATGSDWDDDFSGDMLEKVCLIADLSQAMVSNKPKEKLEVEIMEENKLPVPKRRIPGSDSGLADREFEKLKLEYDKLLEKFKTKEGEVHILRSQLKQNEDAKQAVAIQDVKVLEEIKKNYNEKISAAEKEAESTRMKLQFKDMENKTLSERCRQLEYKIARSKANETQVDGVAQIIQAKETEKETEQISNIHFPRQAHHEGKSLAEIICPEFFKPLEEPSVIPLYTFRRKAEKLYLDKREKYKWADLPKAGVLTKDLYDSVTGLFAYENFSHKSPNEKLEKILESCVKILSHARQVLLFLGTLHEHDREYEDSDRSLLENEDKVRVVTVKHLLDGRRLNEEECGVEGRRSLALIYSLAKTSRAALDLIKKDVEFLVLLKDLSATIGNLRRPLRYNGILVGITLILQRILAEKELGKENLALINDIVEEVIFSRPKLDVLREVVNVLGAGKHHSEFLVGLCREASVDSCSLYMNSKLKQAMFFTNNACPLNVLCMQITGQACLPSSQSIRWDITNCFIKWLNSSVNTPHWRTIKWLPVNSPLTQEDCCFDVTECLLYLLTLCLTDYNLRFLTQDTENVNQKKTLISIIGHGAVLLKRILKADQRQLHNNAYSLRFAVLLKGLSCSKSDLFYPHDMSDLNPVQVEAVSWITEMLESDLRNQDCCVKQTTSTDPDVDAFDALKINCESKIY